MGTFVEETHTSTPVRMEVVVHSTYYVVERADVPSAFTRTRFGKRHGHQARVSLAPWRPSKGRQLSITATSCGHASTVGHYFFILQVRDHWDNWRGILMNMRRVA